MDTQAELTAGAFKSPDTPDDHLCDYGGCQTTDPNGGEDFHPCERCHKRVCDEHAKRRSVYWLCVDCDRAERVSMQMTVGPAICGLANLILFQSLTAEEVQYQLLILEMAVAEIEGAA